MTPGLEHYLIVSALLFALGLLGVITRRFLVRDGHFRIGGATSIQSTGLSEVNRTELLPGRIAKGLCALRAAFLRGPFRRANREANLPGPFVR